MWDLMRMWNHNERIILGAIRHGKYHWADKFDHPKLVGSQNCLNTSMSLEDARIMHNVTCMRFGKWRREVPMIDEIIITKNKAVCFDHTKESPMAVFEFESEKEFDEATENVEEINFTHLEMQREIEDARKHVDYLEEMLQQFEEYYSEYLND